MPTTQRAVRAIIRRPEVLRRSGLSGTTQWRYERDGKFPARIELGDSMVGWYEDEVDQWIHDRVRAAGKPSCRGVAAPKGPGRKAPSVGPANDAAG